VAVFPSIVPEAGPLVFLEALAAGCWPVGTYHAGMAASIDTVAEVLPREDVNWMKLPHQRESLVAGIVRTVTGALALGGRHRDRLRDLAVRRFDWTRVARRLSQELRAA
jgi:glycosyltransferase involved in cell wall biosynthesis